MTNDMEIENDLELLDGKEPEGVVSDVGTEDDDDIEIQDYVEPGFDPNPTPPEQPEQKGYEAPTEKKKGRENAKTRINKLTREKYETEAALQYERDQYQQEKDYLLKENERLRKLSEYSSSVAISNHKSAAKESIERAKQRHIMATEAGDVKEQTEALVALSAAVNELQTVSSWEAQQDYEKKQAEESATQNQQYEQQSYQHQQNQNQHYINIANQNKKAWIEENDWFSSKSANYDPELHTLAGLVSDKLDAHYLRNGKGHLIGDAEYFHALNDSIEKWETENRSDSRPQQAPQGYPQPNYGAQKPYAPQQRPVQNSYQSPVAPVRGNYMSNPGHRQKPIYRPSSQEEVDLMNALAAMGAKKADFVKNKIVSDEEIRQRLATMSPNTALPRGF